MGNEKNKIILLVGKSGAGKDTLARLFSLYHPEVELVISTTSRPMRENEQDGKDYFFITQEEFDRKIEDGAFWEHKVYMAYRDDKLEAWKYGLEKEKNKLESGNFIIPFDLERAWKLKEVLKNNLVVIYIDAPGELRKARAVARDKNFNEKEWYRRAMDEDRIFKNVEKEADYFVKNDNLEVCLKQIENIYLWHEFK